ncbi:MAG: CBS domain-containing protein [Nannocystaceae bacterium]|nr:CBS domain-containing protein [Nannocystaceae bacterium]
MSSERPTVLSLMTPFPYALAANDTLETAQAMMQQHGIHHLPVLRDGVLAGIVSARDIDLCLEVLGAARSSQPVLVWTLCVRDPYVVELDAPLDEVAEQMAARHIGSALVTRNGELAGILTVTDVGRAFAELLRELERATDDDDD